MGNIEASIQIDMREEAGCSVKTRGRSEETVAALTVGAVKIFKAAEKQFGRGLTDQMLATFFRLLLASLNAMLDICPEMAATEGTGEEEKTNEEVL